METGVVQHCTVCRRWFSPPAHSVKNSIEQIQREQHRTAGMHVIFSDEARCRGLQGMTGQQEKNFPLDMLFSGR